jgi:hypothetical protein
MSELSLSRCVADPAHLVNGLCAPVAIFARRSMFLRAARRSASNSAQAGLGSSRGSSRTRRRWPSPINLKRLSSSSSARPSLKHHWALAGVLTVDIRKTPNVKRHQQAIDAIVAKLLIAATTGTLPGKGDARRMAGEGGRRGRAEDLD